MSNFIDEVIKNAKQQIKYSNTITTGEITKNNGDGTYDVKIANSPTAYPTVETATYGDTFSVGEIAIITFEYGNKEMPRLWGHAKKIKQDPKPVEVDYSGETGGGVQEETVTIQASAGAPNGYFWSRETSYSTCHDKSNCGFRATGTGSQVGQCYGWEGSWGGDHVFSHYIQRAVIFFDTSILPVNANIISAKVIFEFWDMTYPLAHEFNIVIQDGQPNYPHNPVIESDYDYSKYVNNGGQINTVDIIARLMEGIYNFEIILNFNGLAWINKGGITKFYLRSSRDIAGRVEGSGEGQGDIYESTVEFVIDSEGEETEPKLVITYTI